MKQRRTSTSIDLTLYLSGSLLSGTQLARFQQILVQVAPEWSSKLHLWRHGEPRLPIDARLDGTLQDLALTKGIETGALFQLLAKTAAPEYPRATGSMELRGAYRGLTVVILLDDWTFCPIGNSWRAGNQIAIQVRKDRIEGRDSPIWVEECFERCCSTLHPLFAFAGATEEYYAKNMSKQGGGLRAIGIDIAKYLPGLYWLNYFGVP